MLLGRSTAEYIVIKAIIYTYGYLGLICLVYFYLALSIGGMRAISHPFSVAVETVGAIEILFYFFWFLPYRNYLHKQCSIFPSPLMREERQQLFYKSLFVTSDIEQDVKRWTGCACLEDLRRENVKEWLLWVLFDKEGQPGEDEEELEEYVNAIEEALGRNIKPGCGSTMSMRFGFRRFDVSHRSLLYYLVR